MLGGLEPRAGLFMAESPKVVGRQLRQQVSLVAGVSEALCRHKDKVYVLTTCEMVVTEGTAPLSSFF